MFGIDLLGFARDLYNNFMGMLVNFIGTSYDLTGTKIVEDMLGNAEGLALEIAGYLAISMLLAALIVRKLRFNALTSFLVVIFAPLLFTLWLGLLDGLRTVGVGLTGLAVGFDVSQIKSSIVLPYPPLDIAAAMWNVPIFVLSGAMAFWFMLVFAMMAIANVAFAVVGIFFVVFYGAGARTRRNFSILLSVVIVTFCIGQPITLLIIKLGNLIGSLAPVTPGSVGLAGLFTLAGMWFAGVVLLWLPFLVYFPVHSVMGKMVSSVSNRVRTQVDNKAKVDANVSGRVDTRQTNRSASVNNSEYRREMSSNMRRAAAATGATALAAMLAKATSAAAAAGSNVHPAAKAAYIAGGAVLRAASTAPKKPPREKHHHVYK